jgi:hypothetical protein
MIFFDDWIVIYNIDTKKLSTYVNNKIKKIKEENLKIKSTRGLESKQYCLLSTFKKDYKKIEPIKEKIIYYINKAFNKKINPVLLSAWTVLGKKNGYHLPHKHNGYDRPHVATVLYLNTPKHTDDEAGNFYWFFRKDNEIQLHHHKPRQGDLIIFPIWVWHGSVPQNDGLRQTLNLDFKINI